MNKNFSYIMNIVLAIAVAVLYYFHFTQGSCSADTTGGTDSTAVSNSMVMSPKEIKEAKTVYVNLDVLNEKYQFILDLSASAQSEQRTLEAQYQSKGQKLQEDYATFQQKAQQGLLSENQINTENEGFARRKEELDQLEMKSQALMEKIQQRNDEANENLRNYIKEYNKKTSYNYVLAFSKSPASQILLVNDSLDITNEILEGLNSQYSASKATDKKK